MRKASEGRVDPERGSGRRLGGGTTYISVNAKSQSEAEWQIERVERREIKQGIKKSRVGFPSFLPSEE